MTGQSDAVIEVQEIPVQTRRQRPLRQYLPWYSVCIAIVHICMYAAIPFGSDAFYALAFYTGRDKWRQLYRWYSYSMAHLNRQHIAVNAVSTIMFGALLEFDNAPWRCCLIHSLSIVAGALGCGWEHRVTGNDIILVGSSGGVYGLLASQVGNLIVNWPEMNVFRRAIFCSVLFTMTVTDSVVGYLYYNPTTSYSTHVGGFIGGLLAGGCLTKNIRKLVWERAFRTSAWTALGAYLTAGCVNVLLK